MNFQTTSKLKATPFVVDSKENGSIDKEMKNLIDVTEANKFKTICFPFGQIFGN